MGTKILLADDSVTVQKIVTLTFSDEGVDVVPVNSGDEAFNRLQYMHPALVMADVSLPGKNGYEICEFVKNHPELKNTPVILLVPAFEPFDEERAARVGADHHLTKPFQSIRTLIATVKNLIDPPTRPPVEPIVWPTTNPPAYASTGHSGVLELPDAVARPTISTGDLLQFNLADTAQLVMPAALTSTAASASNTTLPGASSTGEAVATANSLAAPPRPAAPALTDVAPVVQLGTPPSAAAFDDLDDVLELDDVLPAAPAPLVPVQPVVTPVVVAQPQILAPVPPAASNTITQAVKLTSLEAITTTSIPQSVVDEIADRVTNQVALHLSNQFTQFAAQMFDHLTARLAQDLAPRIASEVLDRINQIPVPPASNPPEPPDSVLDI